MRTLPLAVPGERGHDKTFHVACVLVHGFALPQEDAAELMREYNERLTERWTETELEHKLDGAARATSHWLAPGYLLRRACPRFAPVAPTRPIVWALEVGDQDADQGASAP